MYILLYPSWEPWGGRREAWCLGRDAGCVRREVGNHVSRITFYFSRYNLLIIFRSWRCYAEP
jgi:hypothetical protein